MSLIQFIQSRIDRGSMAPVSLHRANNVARKLSNAERIIFCRPPEARPHDGTLKVHAIALRDAGAFVNMHHRHHSSPIGHLFSLGCYADDVLVGVAIIGRPVARMLDNGVTVEVTRLATSGTRNASSKLLGAARREAKKRGFKRLITYTLPIEGGASLRAAGFVSEGAAGGGSWSRGSRQRIDKHPTEVKARWASKV